MKRYTHTDDYGFTINITWDEQRTILRVESGGEENPQEMTAQFEGLSKWGAQITITLWVTGMIDGGHDLAPVFEALNIPPVKS